MRPTIHSLHTPPALAAWRAIERTLGAWREALKRRRVARRGHEALAGLDDRTLRDLGICRSEITAYAHDLADFRRAQCDRPVPGWH